MIKHLVFKNRFKKVWQKRYFWVVYSEEYGAYNSGWTWTHNGALNEAELYIAKIEDGRGRYFK